MSNKDKKTLNFPLKMSVTLITATLLISCASDGQQSYNMGDVFNKSPTIDKGDETPNEKPDDKPDETPDDKPDETPDDKPDETPDDGYTSPAEADLTGSQVVNIDSVGATTSNDFEISSLDQIQAKANQIAPSLLPLPVDLTIGSDGDENVNDQDYKAYSGETSVATAVGDAPLNYTSIYKDFGNDMMRLGHINGVADTALGLKAVDGVVVLGNKTQTLPTEGTATYKGDATYRLNGADQVIEYGTSNVEVDFAGQSLTADLQFADDNSVSLTASIEGNTFASAEDAASQTNGGFYGEDASYLGGVYTTDGAQGTFGAQKQ